MDKSFLEAKRQVVSNLKTLQSTADLGGDAPHNAVVTLLEEARGARLWEELEEIIAQGKALEIDFAAWRAQAGQTTLSLSWPQKQS